MSQAANQDTQLPESPVQLRDVFPVKLVAKRSRLPEEQAVEAPPVAQMTELVLVENGDQLQVELGLRIAFEPPSQGSFELEVSIVGVFERTGSLPAGMDLNSYVRRIALSLLLPFLREQVFELSTKLRLMPILLPVVIPQASIPPTDESARGTAEPGSHGGGTRPRPARPPSSRPSAASPGSD